MHRYPHRYRVRYCAHVLVLVLCNRYHYGNIAFPPDSWAMSAVYCHNTLTVQKLNTATDDHNISCYRALQHVKVVTSFYSSRAKYSHRQVANCRYLYLVSVHPYFNKSERECMWAYSYEPSLSHSISLLSARPVAADVPPTSPSPSPVLLEIFFLSKGDVCFLHGLRAAHDGNCCVSL